MSCSCERIAGIGQKNVAAGGDVQLLGPDPRRRGLTLSPQSTNTIVVSFGQPGIGNPKFLWLHTAEQIPLFIDSSHFGDALQRDIWLQVGVTDVIAYVELFLPANWEGIHAKRPKP